MSYGCENVEEKILEKEFENCCNMLEIKKFQILSNEVFRKPSKEWPISFISNKLIEYMKQNNIKALISYDEKKDIPISKSLKY